jgi:hypothetical protein
VRVVASLGSGRFVLVVSGDLAADPRSARVRLYDRPRGVLSPALRGTTLVLANGYLSAVPADAAAIAREAEALA